MGVDLKPPSRRARGDYRGEFAKSEVFQNEDILPFPALLHFKQSSEVLKALECHSFQRFNESGS